MNMLEKTGRFIIPVIFFLAFLQPITSRCDVPSAAGRILTIEDLMQLPARGGTLLMGFKSGRRTLDGRGEIATAVVVRSPETPIEGQLVLTEGDEIFAVNNTYFATVEAMGRYINSLQPGANVQLAYFSKSDRGKAVSGLFPVAGPNGFPTANGIDYQHLLGWGAKICSTTGCAGPYSGLVGVLGLGLRLLDRFRDDPSR